MVEQITLRGVVLLAMPISEYDKRLVILTKERGKITAFVRGARRQNSPYLAASQPMTFGEYTVYQGRNAYTVTGVKVTKYFAGDMNDIDKMSYGMYFLEISDYFGREGLEASDSINLIYLAIKALLNENIPNRLVKTIFEMKSLVINGEYPNFFNCSNCGKNTELDMFDLSKETIICNSCHDHYERKSHRFVKMDEAAVYSLQYIVASPISKLFTFSVTDEVLDVISTVVGSCFNKVVDKEFKSLDFLE